MIVENAEPFWQFEKELSRADLAVYAAGRVSERTLNWLESEEMAGCRLVHWGDYVPVACMEYVRLSDRCPGRATMPVPARVAELLPVYGKPSLIADQIDTLAALRHCAAPPQARILTLFDQHRRGLEQEALLI